MALVPRNHNNNNLEHAQALAVEFGLGAWAANQLYIAMENGLNIWEAARPYLPDMSLSAFRARANAAFERLTTPDPEYIQLLNQQAEDGTLGRPAGLARLQAETNDALGMRERADQQLMQIEDRGSMIQQQIDISNEVFQGTFIIQFAI